MEEDEINLGQLLDTLYFQRKLIAAVVALFALLGLAYVILATPVYQSDLLIQIEEANNPARNALSELSAMFEGKTQASAEIEILRSRMVVSHAIDNLHLDIEAYPRYFPLVGAWLARQRTTLSQPGLLGIGGYAWGNEHIEIGKFDVPAGAQQKTFTLTAEGHGGYLLTMEGAGLQFHGHTGKNERFPLPGGAIELEVSQLAGNPGAQFILRHHSHLKEVERLQAQLNVSEKGKQSGILSVNLEGTDPLLITSILNEIGQEYVQQNIERKSAEAEKTLNFLGTYLPALKKSTEDAEARFIALRNARGTVDLSEEMKLILKRSVDAQTKVAELRVKRDELLNRLTPAHPAVEALDAEIAGQQKEVASVNAEIHKLPSLEREVLTLSRDVKINSELYNNLLNTAQQMRLLKAGKTGNVRIIDSAVVAEEPVKPNRPLAFSLFVLAGAVLGVMSAFVRKFLFGGIEDTHEIEERTGLAVFASVPVSKVQTGLYEKIQNKATGMFVLEQIDTSDAAMESLRSFCTALQFAMLEARNNLVMISGPTPGVGKSFVMVNSAAVLAASGKRVLMLDIDLRKGYLNQYFGLPREDGMAELLAGKRTFDQVVHRNILPNLDFVSTGVLPSAPHVLLQYGSMKQFLEKLSEKYDLVLLDTPPVLAVTDATVLSEHVGTTILVARENVTTLADLNETAKRLTQVGSKVSGVVFNALRTRPGRYGYSYGKYRYSSYSYRQYSEST